MVRTKAMNLRVEMVCTMSSLIVKEGAMFLALDALTFTDWRQLSELTWYQCIRYTFTAYSYAIIGPAASIDICT